MAAKSMLNQSDKVLVSKDALKELQDTYVLVNKKELDRLHHEVKQIKMTLPKLITRDLLNAPVNLRTVEGKYQSVCCNNDLLKREQDILKKQFDATLMEVERERKDNAVLRQQILELSDIANKQSEYCAKLGATTCALLWKASQHEDCMHAVLSGDHGNEFILLASHTLESYSAAAQENEISVDNVDDEHHFVVALAGVITNISASAYGREFLMTCQHGKDLLMIIILMISELPMKNSKLMKLKNLALRTLYNVSINQKGLKFLCSKKELFHNLSFTIEADKCCDNRLLALRLIQSVIIEPDCVEMVHVVLELLPVEKLEKLLQGCHGELLIIMQELVKDLRLIAREQ